MAAADGNFADLAALDAASTDQATTTSDQSASASDQASTDIITQQSTPFATDKLAPTFELYMRLNDWLRVNVFNSDPAVTQLILTVRFLTMDGIVGVDSYTIGPLTSNGALNAFAFQLAEGFILSAAVFVPAGVGATRGRTYVTVGLGGQDTTQPASTILLSSYIADASSPRWPIGLVEYPLNGRGWVHSVASPLSMGTFNQITVPVGVQWRLISLMALVQTDAIAGNRQVFVRITQGGLTVFDSVAAQTQPANNLTEYAAAAGLPVSAQGTQFQVLTIPPDCYLRAGDTVEIHINNIDPADQITTFHLSVEEWLEP